MRGCSRARMRPHASRARWRAGPRAAASCPRKPHRAEGADVYGRTHRIHFIGIGGSGMSGLAEVLLNMGYVVTGSDLKTGEVTDRLVTLGGRVFEGHAATNIEGAHVVVYSSAVRPDNPELVAAREAGLPVIARADMLA